MVETDVVEPVNGKAIIVNGHELEHSHAREYVFDHGYSEERLRKINVAAQMRVHFPEDSVSELARSINSSEQINPLIVCSMTEELARKYVEYTNEIWGRNVSFDDFEPIDGRRRPREYQVLVAGERRLRAMSTLDDYVREKKQVKIAQRSVTDENGFVYLTALQAAENLYEKPETYGYAVAAYTLYRIGEYDSVSEFVRDMGGAVGETQARDSISFFQLPEEVREMTEKGTLPYTSGVELARYQQHLYESMMTKRVNSFLAVANKEESQEDQFTIDDIPEDTLSEMSQEMLLDAKVQVYQKALFVKNNGIQSSKIAKLRIKWLDELNYDQPNFADLDQLVIENDEHIKQMMTTVRQIRRIINGVSRVTEGHRDALGQLIATTVNGRGGPILKRRIEANVARQIRSLESLLLTVMGEYEGREPSSVGKRVLELLEMYPDQE